MLVQAVALAVLVAGGGAFAPAIGAAALLGLGTALVDVSIADSHFIRRARLGDRRRDRELVGDSSRR